MSKNNNNNQQDVVDVCSTATEILRYAKILIDNNLVKGMGAAIEMAKHILNANLLTAIEGKLMDIEERVDELVDEVEKVVRK